ncbi:hypothetical protein TorRG33x02_137240 [Trema orientale]|uniref:Uncharacterized protein n=1 Tax=Trema orientale TaxID=63057 RepID=A0A2P5EY32_TREOI|nr:hypothetical protein TorRG33x02_137240 [Trema orientale]
MKRGRRTREFGRFDPRICPAVSGGHHVILTTGNRRLCGSAGTLLAPDLLFSSYELRLTTHESRHRGSLTFYTLLYLTQDASNP